MPRAFGFIFLTALCWLWLALAVLAEDPPARRLALVIGNSAYGSVPVLDNPVNDAKLIAGSLRDLGFEVTLLKDANQIEMKRGVAQFGRELRQAGPSATGLFYYAGHGVQSFGTNYLLPVDVALMNPADLDLVAVEAQSVLRQMFSAKNHTNIVILDACRNNPFTDIPEFNDNGLAEMDAPTGTYLAYATAPGGVALDGNVGNSPFTRSIVGYMSTPGLPIEQMFKKVRKEVLDETDGAQTPWDASSLISDFMFAPPVEEAIAADAGEERDWREAQAAADAVGLIEFLRQYPASVHKSEAGDLLAAVMAGEFGLATRPAPRSERADGPSAVEEKLYRSVRADPSETAYRLYLKTFPDGAYSSLARLEIAALRDKGAAASAGAAAADDPPPEQAAMQPQQEVTYIGPLTSDEPRVAGKSIAVLLHASPLYPPVADLPDAYWKEQTCSSCHKWSEDRLCDHATRYLAPNMARALRKKHPFGGSFKRGLRDWALGGCQ